MNIRELRHQILKHSDELQHRLFSHQIDIWNKNLEMGKEPGKYPQYPTDESILSLAKKMTSFVEGNYNNDVEEG